MINKLNVTAVKVPDQDQALDFYFYGTDMGVRDPFGNAIRILRPAKVAQPATA